MTETPSSNREAKLRLAYRTLLLAATACLALLGFASACEDYQGGCGYYEYDGDSAGTSGYSYDYGGCGYDYGCDYCGSGCGQDPCSELSTKSTTVVHTAQAAVDAATHT